ncbi:SMP-30/gluconolactonase/LRE family protein [Curtobacterium ammoniigenes]|uniref:SMP-30/gluconolactonase/LRE family protein n=1 Tax=Curtobacterium ammoniigenes TaxID=395387 RepID=UPI00082B76AA|nr:SMP-30/gluconolactonase/LRE family protein [Curtobacterium ammoniigenes]
MSLHTLYELVSNAEAELLAGDSIWAEGPLWIPETRTLRWSDIPRNRILQWHAETGAQSVYADQVEFTNGRTLDRDGSVVQCSHGRRRIERDRGGVVEGLADHWEQARFNSPNDVVIAPDGTIWFTDPSYGITEAREGHAGYREYGDRAVFRYDPATGSVRPVVLDVEAPNGLAFSPDGGTLYVADSSAAGQPEGIGNRLIRAYEVVDGIQCKNSRVFARYHPMDGVPDGIKVDEHGNLWASSGLGIIVYDPEGTRLGIIPVPEVVANCCFGGDDGTDLFITATTSLYRIRTRVRDAWAIRR